MAKLLLTTAPLACVANLGVLPPAWAQAPSVPAPSASASPAPAAPIQLAAGNGLPGVEEVVVTARHRTEKAQKVPISLTAISGAKLDANGTTSITSLSTLVPTLQVSEFNPRNTSFNIRGIGNNVSISNDGLESGVGIYVDGVLYARPGTAAFAFPDIDSVQVLRGPQGTLFGKNTTAGAIDVRTAPPTFTPHAELEASVGNYGFWQLKGTVSDGFNDKVAARVSFLADERDGTITSVVSGAHYGTQDDKAVRVQLLAMPTDDLTLRLITDYAHQLENCCVNMAAGVFTTLNNGTPIPYNFYQREAFTGYQLPNTNPFGRDTAINAKTYFEMETGGVSLQADYLLNDFTLTSISAWRFWNWWPFNGASPAIGLQTETAGNQIDWQKQASQEFRVTSPTGGPVDYTGGLFFFYQDLEGQQHLQWGEDAGPYYIGPKLPKPLSILALNNYTVLANTDPVTNSYAGYGQATWHVLAKLDLTGGLRYTYEDKSGSFDQTVGGAAPLDGLPPALAAALSKVRDQFGIPLYYKNLTHNGALSYMLDASYHLTDDLMAYATYSRGNKSNGVNVTQLPANIDPIVKPERVDNYEIGLKSAWFDNRLVANIDAFWIEDSDYQGIAVAPLTAQTYTYYVASVPKVKSQGFELDTTAKPFDWLSLNFAAAYTDAIYESYPNGQCPPEVSGAATEICDETGKNLPGNSRWTMTLGSEITQPIGSYGRYDIVGYAGADFTLRSSFNVAASDSIYSEVPGYGLLNVRLGARTADGKYDLFLWSHNATNTDYYLVRGVAAPFSGLLYGNIGDPVTFGATARIRF